MAKEDPDHGYFEEEPENNPEEISDDEIEAILADEVGGGGELRLTYIALRHQLLDRAKTFVSEGNRWKQKPLRQRLAELQATYRLMAKLTEEE